MFDFKIKYILGKNNIVVNTLLKKLNGLLNKLNN